MYESFCDSYIYQRERLKVHRGYGNKEGVVTAVAVLMKQLISEAISTLDTHFSSFQQVVLISRCVLFPSTWTFERAVLAKFGHEEIHLLSTHFAHPLQDRGYTPDVCMDEWAELKIKVVHVLS